MGPELPAADSPKLANLEGRATLVWSDGYSDVEHASMGRFSHDIHDVLSRWDYFQDWSQGMMPQISGSPDMKLMGPPVPRPSQIFAIGLNYREHTVEAGYDTGGLPQVFTKFSSCLTGPSSHVTAVSSRIDWEVELVAVLGRTGRDIGEDEAWSFVAGLMIGQDISARDVQLAGSAPQWSLGKSFAGFGPTGPWITSARDCPGRDDLGIECELNGERMQSDRTSSMIWSVSELVARLSTVCELRAGDLIFTGTPAGIGNRRSPPKYISPGDRLVSRIETLGEIVSEFVSPGVDVTS